LHVDAYREIQRSVKRKKTSESPVQVPVKRITVQDREECACHPPRQSVSDYYRQAKEQQAIAEINRMMDNIDLS
jgi:hypothetical protein